MLRLLRPRLLRRLPPRRQLLRLLRLLGLLRLLPRLRMPIPLLPTADRSPMIIPAAAIALMLLL